MSDEYLEYEVFNDVTSDGKEIELAIVDRFDFEEKSYVVAALVEGDEISEDGLFVYRLDSSDGESEIVKIEDPEEYSRIADAYAQI